MKLTAAGEPHLTYCTNIHSGESWAEIKRNLEVHVTAVKRRFAPDRPFGVGLRLSGRAAAELAEGEELAALRAWLDAEGLYVFTINGFPYGVFHRVRVKEEVYLPDWLDDERLAYTNRLAEILAVLVPDGIEGSVSTAPGAFKPRVRDEADADAIADRILRHAATLVRLQDRTGRRIALAIEPEPFCQLETIAESVAFFEDRLFARTALARFGRWSGLDGTAAEEALRAHVGICFDACHMAVEFEPLDGALARLAASAIRIPKIQISAGLEVRPEERPAPELLRELARFAEEVYLHQVTEAGPGGLRRWLDLPDAIASAATEGFRGRWRIHFHVPLYREDLGAFHGTQPYLTELLGRLRGSAIAPHLEVETYTWNVLPEEHRQLAIADAIARDLAWVVDGLDARGSR